MNTTQINLGNGMALRGNKNDWTVVLNGAIVLMQGDTKGVTHTSGLLQPSQAAKMSAAVLWFVNQCK